MKILVVDDSAMMRRAIKSILNNAGYENVEEAEHGAEALNMLKTCDYQLVLIDWNMPVMSGPECVEEIRKLDCYRGLPIIMVTTEADQARVMTAMRHGVSDYMVKPVSPTLMLEKIARLTGNGRGNSSQKEKLAEQARPVHGGDGNEAAKQISGEYELSPDVKAIVQRVVNALREQGIKEVDAARFLGYCVKLQCDSDDEEAVGELVDRIREDPMWDLVS